MTVLEAANPRRYISGAAADLKPDQVPPGSTFVDVNGVPWRSYDGRNWRQGLDSLLTGLISYWRGNEASGALLDDHGANPGAVFAGAPGTRTGLYSAHFRDFRGSPVDSFTVPNVAELQLAGSFSVMARCQLDEIATEKHLIRQGNYAATGPNPQTGAWSLEEGAGGSGQLQFFRSTTGALAGVLGVTSSVAAVIGTWYTILGWFDATLGQMGISVNGTESTTASAAANYVSESPLYLGASPSSTMAVDGAIGDWAIWSRVLTAAERKLLADAVWPW